METTKPLRYFIYCRKSSEDNRERQMQSIESQEAELKELIKEKNLEVVEIFREEKSAHVPGRKIFNEMLKRIEEGEANGLLTWHENRIARNAFDAGQVITLMDSGKILEVRTLHRIYSYSSPGDKFMLGLEMIVSKKDSDEKSQVVKRGLNTKCNKGWRPGGAPMGYKNTPELAGGSRYIKKDEERFELLKKVWHMFASGEYSVANIQKLMNEEWGFKTRQYKRQGGKLISQSALYKMLNDSFYCGLFEYPRGSGTVYEGTHDKMISREIFDRVQGLLGNKLKPQIKKNLFAYTGMMVCGECGCQITASEKHKYQKNGNAHHYTYYHCTKRKYGIKCSQRGVEIKLLESQISNILKSIAVPAEFHHWAMKWLRRIDKTDSKDLNLIISRQRHEYTECLNTLDGIIDLRAIGKIDDDDFLRRKEVLTEKKKRLEEALRVGGGVSGNWLEKADDVLTFSEKAQEKFATGNLKTKKQILSAMGRNLVLRDKKIKILLDDVLFPVQTLSKKVIKESSRLEPLKNKASKRKTDDFSSVSPSLLRG